MVDESASRILVSLEESQLRLIVRGLKELLEYGDIEGENVEEDIQVLIELLGEGDDDAEA